MDAVVVQANSFPYPCGKTIKVPCGAPCCNEQEFLGEFWAVPTKDDGIFRGYHFVVRTDNTAPTPDSFKVTRISDRTNGRVYYVLGTKAQLDASCADDGVTPMPLATTIPVPVPDFYVCMTESGADDGKWVWTWTAPAKAGADEYRAHVVVNNVQAVPAASGGHASIAAMITWLNANYAAAGTWSNPSGNIIKLVSTTDKKVGLSIVVGNFT